MGVDGAMDGDGRVDGRGRGCGRKMDAKFVSWGEAREYGFQNIFFMIYLSKFYETHL